MSNPRKPFLVLGLICIFTIFVNCCSEREACSGVDRTRIRNARECTCNGSSTNSEISRFNDKYLKLSKGTKQSSGQQINQFIDGALQAFINYIKKQSGGKTRVPNFSTFFTTGSGFFAVKGEFHAAYGQFSDLTTIQRKADATVHRSGQKILITCSLGLTTAKIQYDFCNVIYGYVSRQGPMSVNLAPLTFSGKIMIDYSEKRCVTSLEELEVQELGPIECVISNLGALGSIINSAVNAYIQKTSERIRRMVKIETSKIIASRLPYFNCEPYRLRLSP